MPSLLDRLEAAKRNFSAGAGADTAGLLASLRNKRFRDAQSLIRFHEAVLLLRAYPASKKVLRLADEILGSFSERLRGVDLTPFEEPDVSGISGTAFSAIFTYDMVRWLAEHHPSRVEIDWDGYDPERLAPLLRRLFPLYPEDALVEANIPYLDWLHAAKRTRGSDFPWLIKALERLPMDPEDRAELFGWLRVPVRLEIGDGPRTRSRMRLPGIRRYFYHETPLLRRSDVSLAAELAGPRLPVRRLARAKGEQMIDLARETSVQRYRELHGFTYGDPRYVFRVEMGRGVVVFAWGVPPHHRLPLRAYHCGMMFKNAVPVGYFETLSLFERCEVGFNLYYTFREGETAWLYAKLLRLFRQLLGVTCFSVDPYQIGQHNDEAIESGAFWFYRKLGFRPTHADAARLLEREEVKLRADAAYRTTARVLRRLAESPMIYEMPGTPQGDWDRFEVRRAAMAFGTAPFDPEIARAKKAPQESAYLRALQRSPKLRQRFLSLSR